MNRQRDLAGAIALCGLVLAGCDGEASTTKAGGDPEPIVLRIGTNDFPGRPAADQIEEFGRHVADLTDGGVQVEEVWEVGGHDIRDWDQVVARQVIDGELDGANVPARAWDRLGVTSMTAFHAPFLITSELAMNTVLTDDELVAEMLEGLEGSGVTGLAIVPERIRYLFGFDRPFVTPADFEGAVIRTPSSATSYRLFEALGAVPDDLPRMDDAITNGSLTAVDSSFGSIDSVVKPSMTGNLALYPKANVLVINDAVFGELSDEHQSALRRAAAASRDWAITDNPAGADLAAEFCDGGGHIVNATDDDVAAIHALAEPVHAELAAVPGAASMIDRIREIVDGMAPAPTIEPCEPTATIRSSDQPAGFDIRDLDGVYRFEFTADDARAAGIDEAWIARNQADLGVITVVLDGGAINDQNTDGQGVYTISGTEVTFRVDDWSSHWVMVPEFANDGISWTFVKSLPPWGTPSDELIDAAFWTTAQWIRVGDVGSIDPTG